MIPNPIVVDMGITEPQTIPMTVSESGGAIPIGIGTAVTPIAGRVQPKTVEFTPTATEQTETVTPDVGYDALTQVTVVVGAIPNNYGRITWNGSILTVS